MRFFIFFSGILIIFIIAGCKKENSEVSTELLSKNNCIVITIQGKAFFTTEDDMKNEPLTVGSKLDENDMIKTEDNSFVELQIGNSSIVKIKENSLLKIARLYKNDDIQNTNLFLKNGKILANPEKQGPGSNFEVETESITAGVRGTEFSVTFEDNRLKKKIAVLPFSYENGDGNYEYLSSTLRDAILAKLNLPGNYSFISSNMIDLSLKKMKSSKFPVIDKPVISAIIKDIKPDLLIAGRYAVNGGNINLSVSLYDSKGNGISDNTKSGNNGIEIFDYIGDICYKLSSDIKKSYPDKSVTRIAVNEGSVICTKKIDVNHMERIKEIDPDLAVKMEKASVFEMSVDKGQVLEIPQEEIRKVEANFAVINTQLVEKVQEKKLAQSDISKIVERIENENLKEISVVTNKEIVKRTISAEDKVFLSEVQEFQRISKMQDDMETKIEKSINETVKTDNEQTVKKEVGKKYELINDTISREDDKNYMTPVSISKNDEEKSRSAVYLFKKTITGFGLDLPEINTSVVSDNVFIYVTEGRKGSVICMTLDNPAILWVYEDPEIKKMGSPAVPYKEDAVLCLYDKILVLNTGKIKNKFDMGNGTGFWAFPEIINDILYIPVNKGIFAYDGNSVVLLQNLPKTYGQLYISRKDGGLLVADSIYSGIFDYDIISGKTVWKSDRINKDIFSDPEITKDYIIIADAYDNIYRFSKDGKTTGYQTAAIKTGNLSNMAHNVNTVYFVGKDGYFYRFDAEKFVSADRIVKVENDPNRNKFLTKKLLISGNDLFYASDNGKLFHYDMVNEINEFFDTTPSNSTPFVASPVLLNNGIVVLDIKGNIYRLIHVYQ